MPRKSFLLKKKKKTDKPYRRASNYFKLDSRKLLFKFRYSKSFYYIIFFERKEFDKKFDTVKTLYNSGQLSNISHVNYRIESGKDEENFEESVRPIFFYSGLQTEEELGTEKNLLKICNVGRFLIKKLAYVQPEFHSKNNYPRCILCRSCLPRRDLIRVDY